MVSRAFYLPARDGQRFCIFHAPNGEGVRAALVYLHPFAEEMNKSRRMAALQARALAAAGCAVMQIDLHGCGDSSGDFGDATWDSWLSDVELACGWLRQQTDAPLWLWGLRTGCLLAVEAAAALPEPVGFVFWQPVVTGKQFLQQFLRLKTAAAMLGGDRQEAGGLEALRRQLSHGESVEVGGYLLSPGLAMGLDQAELVLQAKPGRIVWLESSAKADGTLMPVSSRRIEHWRAAGYDVHASAVTGPSFWMTSEVVDSPALLAATERALLDGGGPA